MKRKTKLVVYSDHIKKKYLESLNNFAFVLLYLVNLVYSAIYFIEMLSFAFNS